MGETDDLKPADLFTAIIEKHKKALEKWALEQTHSREKADELIQEIYIKIFLFTSKERTKSSDIKRIDDYIWAIAWNTLKKINKKGTSDKIVSLDSEYYEYFKRNIPYIDPYLDEDNPIVDHTEEYAKLRRFILRLDMLEREITIMYYWDKMTLGEIAENLMISTYTVENYLVKIRHKLKLLFADDSVNFIKTIRPRKLFISYYKGFLLDNDSSIINNDVIKQNICLACFEMPRSIEDILDILNVSRPYLEQELQWLISKGLIYKNKRCYKTQFFIFTANVYQEIFQSIVKSKPNIVNLIIGKLIYRKQKIKSIGFQGANEPINKLLWFLIPNLIKYIINRQYQNSTDLNEDRKSDMPIGFEYLFDKEDFREILGEKYANMAPWNKIGYLEIDDGAMNINLIQQIYTNDNELPYNIMESGGKYHNLFELLFTKRTSTGELERSDREALDNMVRWGMIEYIDDDNIVPKFFVFTESQHKALQAIFKEISKEMKDSLPAFNKVMRICDSYTSTRKNLLFIASSAYISTVMRVAFFEGTLYKPINEREANILSFIVTLKG